jgi:hypothetical protein
MAYFDRQAALQAGMTPEQIETFMKQKGLSDLSPEPAPQPQNKGFRLSDLLPIAGAVVGGIAGAPLGGVGAIGGSGVGSSLGEALRQRLEGEKSNVGKIATEGAFGLAGGAVGKVAGKALGLGVKALPKASGLGKAGTSVIASQYNVPRSTARVLKMNETLSRLSDYGLSNIDDVASKSRLVTGESGLITKLTRQAVSKAKPVSTDGLLNMVDDLVTREGGKLTAADKKAVFRFMQSELKSLYGGAGGSLSTKSRPLDIFDTIQRLEKTASSFGVNKASHQLTPQEQGFRKVYQQLADELKDRLFRQSGADRALVSNVLRNVDPGQLQGIGPKFFDDLSRVKTVGELRSLAAPFVRGAQLAAETEAGSQLATQTAAGAVKGVGKLVQNPLNLLAAPLGSNKVNAAVGQTMRQGLPQIPQSLGVRIAGQTAAQIAPRAVMGSPAEAQGLPEEPVGLGSQEPVRQTQDGSSEGAFSREMAMMMMMQDLQTTGGKNMAAIKSFYEFANPKSSEKPLGVEQQKTKFNAESGMRALQTLEQKLSSDPAVLLKGSIPGAPGARVFQTARKEATDVITRLRTGAAINKNEEKFYMSQLPAFGDSQETINYKINLLRSLFEQFVYNQMPASSQQGLPPIDQALP